MQQVMFTLNGECYHKFRYVKIRPGNEYAQSECGMLDSINWNVLITHSDHWRVKNLRPCKRCYKKDFVQVNVYALH